tara:strand:+ start:2161 stop:2814 length:654 start_codon:yes stop_codon:yes gene_type:complete
MAYFLGRDVVVALTTEDASALVCSVSNAAALVEENAYASQTVIAGPRLDLGAGTSTFGTQTTTASGTPTFTNECADLTGVDLSIGATDEDITYFGQRTALKAEIKKETTLSLTKKKSDNSWDVAFNEARCGINAAGTGIRTTLDGAPDDVNYGYRVYVKMKNSEEIFVLRNACITGHTVSLNADGTTEETLELYSYIQPLIKSADADVIAATDAGDL